MPYTTWGPQRGCCGHFHKNFYTALDCLRKDQKWCEEHGIYPDRQIRRIQYRREMYDFPADKGPGEWIVISIERVDSNGN